MIMLKRRYVYEDVDRWGNVRIYFWRGRGHRKVRCTENPGTEAFDRAYHELSKAMRVNSSQRRVMLPNTVRFGGWPQNTSIQCRSSSWTLGPNM